VATILVVEYLYKSDISIRHAGGGEAVVVELFIIDGVAEKFCISMLGRYQMIRTVMERKSPLVSCC